MKLRGRLSVDPRLKTRHSVNASQRASAAAGPKSSRTGANAFHAGQIGRIQPDLGTGDPQVRAGAQLRGDFRRRPGERLERRAVERLTTADSLQEFYRQLQPAIRP